MTTYIVRYFLTINYKMVCRLSRYCADIPYYYYELLASWIAYLYGEKIMREIRITVIPTVVITTTTTEVHSEVFHLNTLAQIKEFYSAGNVFSVLSPQTITIHQGDGRSVNVTLYGSDTMYDVAAKINNAIAFGLGQAAYVNRSDMFSTISDGRENTSESVYKSEPIYGVRDYERNSDGSVILDRDGNKIPVVLQR